MSILTKAALLVSVSPAAASHIQHAPHRLFAGLLQRNVAASTTTCPSVPPGPSLCARSCGEGKIICPGGAGTIYCFNPGAGETCCQDGYYCTAGSYCARYSDGTGTCCSNNQTLADCGVVARGPAIAGGSSTASISASSSESSSYSSSDSGSVPPGGGGSSSSNVSPGGGGGPSSSSVSPGGGGGPSGSSSSAQPGGTQSNPRPPISPTPTSAMTVLTESPRSEAPSPPGGISRPPGQTESQGPGRTTRTTFVGGPGPCASSQAASTTALAGMANSNLNLAPDALAMLLASLGLFLL